MAEIIFLCEKCGISIEANDSLCGGTAVCPNCQNEVRVPAPLLQEGLDLNGFVLEKLLGAGGMGQVWLANQTAMERKIALKILDQNLGKSKEFVERFLREAKNLAKLAHNNVVAAIDAGYSRGIYYMAVGFVDGYELGQKLDEVKTLPEKQAIEITRGIAEGLCYAWNKHKIIHRDIKPANIMIDSEGIPKLMDLGISKSMGEDRSLTMTGVVIGTPYYISPEQGKGVKEIDFHADIYSLGATLYHVVTGELPYNGPTTISIITQHITEPFPPPQERNPAVSDQCAALLEIMMAKKPEKRQQSWEAVIKDMNNVLEGKFPESKRPATGETLVTRKVSGLQKTASTQAPRKTSMEMPPLPQQVPVKAADANMMKTMIVVLSCVSVAIVLGIVMIIVRSMDKPVVSRTQDMPKTTIEETKNIPPAVVVQPVATPPPVNVAVPPVTESKREPVKPVPEKVPEHEKAPELVNIPDRPLPRLLEPLPINDQDGFAINEKPEEKAPAGAPEQKEKSAIDRLLSDLQALNPEMRIEGIRIDIDEKGVWKIDLNDKPVHNISPLTSLQISFLNLSRTGVGDLNALKNSKITDLYLDWTNVTDLSPLKGMPLKTLSLSGSQARDFSVLKDMPLENLNLGDSNVKDISFLKGKQLKILSLKRTDVNDLGPLKGMKLQQLSLFETNFKSFKPIEDIPLEWILISPRILNPDIYRTLKKMKTLKFISPGPDFKLSAEEFFRRFAWAEKGQQPQPFGGPGFRPPGEDNPQP
ncbi:MAG TPA: hypothetical protein DCZ94_17775 [Lentisphaeria bacterium]|nr:MAG: hypothetical protein A2X48_03675 [Lentisphaerae bacterium GWF2_49_21]HBC88795.1 hypothetical protein [Lentisphaeria bacterium]